MGSYFGTVRRFCERTIAETAQVLFAIGLQAELTASRALQAFSSSPYYYFLLIIIVAFFLVVAGAV